MPCLYAHTLFGFSVRDRLPQPLAALLARNEAAFLAGLPGPDIYFFDRFPPPLLHPHEKRTGNALHNAPADTVFAQLLSLAAGDEALLAYTLGFLCHYALDSAIHPFVDARYRGLDHTRFEMRLELAFCARRGSRLSGIPPHRLYAPPVREPDLLDRLDALQHQLAQAVCQRGARGAFRRSFFKFRRTNRLLYDPAGRKRRLLQRVERLLRRPAGTLSSLLFAPPQAGDGDLFNEMHAPWRAPWEGAPERTESFFDLYDAAADRAVALLPLCYAAWMGDSPALLLQALKGGNMAHGTYA